MASLTTCVVSEQLPDAAVQVAESLPDQPAALEYRTDDEQEAESPRIAARASGRFLKRAPIEARLLLESAHKDVRPASRSK